MHFMSKEEALKTMHLIGVAAENKGISRSFLKDWMVWLYISWLLAMVLNVKDTYALFVLIYLMDISYWRKEKKNWIVF